MHLHVITQGLIWTVEDILHAEDGCQMYDVVVVLRKRVQRSRVKQFDVVKGDCAAFG